MYNQFPAGVDKVASLKGLLTTAIQEKKTASNSGVLRKGKDESKVVESFRKALTGSPDFVKDATAALDLLYPNPAATGTAGSVAPPVGREAVSVGVLSQQQSTLNITSVSETDGKSSAVDEIVAHLRTPSSFNMETDEFRESPQGQQFVMLAEHYKDRADDGFNLGLDLLKLTAKVFNSDPAPPSFNGDMDQFKQGVNTYLDQLHDQRDVFRSQFGIHIREFIFEAHPNVPEVSKAVTGLATAPTTTISVEVSNGIFTELTVCNPFPTPVASSAPKKSVKTVASLFEKRSVPMVGTIKPEKLVAHLKKSSENPERDLKSDIIYVLNVNMGLRVDKTDDQISTALGSLEEALGSVRGEGNAEFKDRFRTAVQEIRGEASALGHPI